MSRIRYTGSSGVDVESLVTQLMDAESLRKNKVYKDKMLLDWQQTALRGIGNNIKTFQNNFLSFTSPNSIANMRSLGTFSTTGAKISLGGVESSAISAKPSHNATTGNREVEIVQTAEAEQRVSSTAVSGSIKGSVDFDPSGIEEGDYFNIEVNGTPKKISFDQADVDAINGEVTATRKKEKLQELVQNKLTQEFGTYNGEAKVQFSLEADGMFSIKSHPEVNSEISFSAFNSTKNSLTVVTAAQMPVDEDGIMTSEKSFTFKIDNKQFTIGTTGRTKEQFLNTVNNALGGSGVQGVTASFDDSGNLIFSSDFDTTDKNITVSSKKIEHFSQELSNGVDFKLADSAAFTLDADGKVTNGTVYNFNINGAGFEVDTAGKTKDEITAELNTSFADAGISDLTASVDADGHFILTPGPGSDGLFLDVSSQNAVHLENVTLEDSDAAIDFGIPSYQASTKLNLNQTLEEAFGSTGTIDFTINGKDFSFDAALTSIDDAMSQINASGAGVTMTYNNTSGMFAIEASEEGAANAINFGGDASVFFDKFNIDVTGPATTAAQDAIVKIDGTQLVRDSNNFTYDDITYDITNGKAGDVFTVEVGSEVNDTFDNIIKFVNDYNKLIDEMQSSVKETRKKAGSYSYYEPLTEKEKAGMSEKEIEKYDEAAKEGILYRNEHLQKLTRKLREAMNTPVTLENGEKLYLHQLGITTGDYTKGAQLEVDQNKLKDALEKYGSDVGQLFAGSGELVDGEYENQGIMELVNTAIDEAVGSKGYISKYAGFEDTIYVRENTLSRKIDDKDKKLADLEAYLYRKENYYYKMFAAMEASINESNNQMSYLMG